MRHESLLSSSYHRPPVSAFRLLGRRRRLRHSLPLLVAYPFALRLAPFDRVPVLAALVIRLLGLYLDSVYFGIGVVADAAHLPRHFNVGFVGLDGEAAVLDLAR